VGDGTFARIRRANGDEGIERRERRGREFVTSEREVRGGKCELRSGRITMQEVHSGCRGLKQWRMENQR
jgi:hypothetical protein